MFLLKGRSEFFFTSSGFFRPAISLVAFENTQREETPTPHIGGGKRLAADLWTARRKPWSRLAAAAEEHTGWRSCQLGAGKPGSTLHSLAKTGKPVSKKGNLGWSDESRSLPWLSDEVKIKKKKQPKITKSSDRVQRRMFSWHFWCLFVPVERQCHHCMWRWCWAAGSSCCSALWSTMLVLTLHQTLSQAAREMLKILKLYNMCDLNLFWDKYLLFHDFF